jgi:hypothetical protein
MIKYKAGYLLTIDSWENDADNSTTNEIHYADKAKLTAAIAFCTLFTKSHHEDTEFIGNFSWPRDGDILRIENIFYKFYLSNKCFFEEESDDPELIKDWCMDEACDFGLSGTDFYTRVCDDIKVEYFKEDVHAEDITRDFVG